MKIITAYFNKAKPSPPPLLSHVTTISYNVKLQTRNDNNIKNIILYCIWKKKDSSDDNGTSHQKGAEMEWKKNKLLNFLLLYFFSFK